MNTKIKIIAIVLIGIVLGGIMLFEDQTHSELQSEKDTAVNAYLTVNWTSREILWEHDIMPNDSGRGWEFWLADIDLDGIEEMLISFLANHCGQNSLYVYQYENNSVTLYGDMIAVPDKDVITFIDYKKISPFMDIELVDVYTNRQNEYRHLSIDCFSIGGMDRIFLYETVPENNFKQEELANIIYEYNDTEQWEIYFQGERLASTKDLNDMISRHMEGYEKQEICYTHLEKTFPRDIFGMSIDQQKRELEELSYCSPRMSGKNQNFAAAEASEEDGITMTSVLFCKHGGLIMPVTSGQENIIPDSLEDRIQALVAGVEGKPINSRNEMFALSTMEILLRLIYQEASGKCGSGQNAILFSLVNRLFTETNVTRRTKANNLYSIITGSGQYESVVRKGDQYE